MQIVFGELFVYVYKMIMVTKRTSEGDKLTWTEKLTDVHLHLYKTRKLDQSQRERIHNTHSFHWRCFHYIADTKLVFSRLTCWFVYFLVIHSFIHSIWIHSISIRSIASICAYVFVCTQFTISPIKLSTSERNRQCVRVMQCLHCVLNVLSIQNPIDSLINKWFYKTAHINSYDVRALFCPFLILSTVSLCERAYNLQPVPFQFCT